MDEALRESAYRHAAAAKAAAEQVRRSAPAWAAWELGGLQEKAPASLVSTVMKRIRERYEEKQAEYDDYLAHARLRLREQDLHGLWDCGANASEVSNYMDGLRFALELLEGAR